MRITGDLTTIIVFLTPRSGPVSLRAQTDDEAKQTVRKRRFTNPFDRQALSHLKSMSRGRSQAIAEAFW